jgi:hypothetical protein
MLDFLFQALHAAADQLSAAFLICGADGRIYHANHAAKEMLEAHWPVRRHNQAYLRVSDRARHEVVLGGLRQLAADASLTDPCQLSLEIPLSSPRSSRGAAIATLSPLVLQEQRFRSFRVRRMFRPDSSGNAHTPAIHERPLRDRSGRGAENFVQYDQDAFAEYFCQDKNLASARPCDAFCGPEASAPALPRRLLRRKPPWPGGPPTSRQVLFPPSGCGTRAPRLLKPSGFPCGTGLGKCG